MNLTCYILDDEPHALDLLQAHIRDTPGLELTGRSTDPKQALGELVSLKPDLLFLDIDMPEISGLELAQLVAKDLLVVFTTAHREYGPEAFERAAADYLLKPVFYPRFFQCIQKVRSLVESKEGGPTHLFVSTGVKGQSTSLEIAAIRFVRAELHYLEIHLADRTIITHLNLNELLGKLPAGEFSRIHKSHLVSHRFIGLLETGRVVLKDGTALDIGKTYRPGFLKKMNALVVTS